MVRSLDREQIMWITSVVLAVFFIHEDDWLSGWRSVSKGEIRKK